MAKLDRHPQQCRLVVVWLLTCSDIGQWWLTLESIGLNKDVSHPRGLSYLLATWIFCSGFLSSSNRISFSSLENPTEEVFQLTYWVHFCQKILFHQIYVVVVFFWQEIISSEVPWPASALIVHLLRCEAHQELSKSALCYKSCSPGWFVKSSSRMLRSLRDPLDICQEVLPCRLTGGVGGALWNGCRGADGNVCSCTPSHRLCFLPSDSASEQSACKEIELLLLFSSAISAGDQTALLQQVILCLSLLSVFPDNKITHKWETCH